MLVQNTGPYEDCTCAVFPPNEAVYQCNTTVAVAHVGAGVTLLLMAITQHGQIPAGVKDSAYPLYHPHL